MEYFTVYQTLEDRFRKKEISKSAYNGYLAQLKNCTPTIYKQGRLKNLMQRILRHGRSK